MICLIFTKTMAKTLQSPGIWFTIGRLPAVLLVPLGAFWCTFKDRGLIGLVPRPLTSQFRTPAALPLHAPDDLARNG